MHSFFASILLAALASSAAGLPGLHGPFNIKADLTTSVPFPTGTGFPSFGDHTHKEAFGTGSAHGTGTHTKHHHHHTGTGGGHHSASATLAGRQLSETGAPSFTGSFPKPTGADGFAHGSGFFGHPTGHGGHHSHTGSGFASPTDGIHNVKHFPSLSIPSGTGFGGGFPTGTGGFAAPSGTGHHGHHSHDGHSEPSQAANILPRSFGRRFPLGAADPSGRFPSLSIPTGTGFGGGAPTGGFGGAFPTQGFGGHGKGFPAGTGGFEPTGGFASPTGKGGFHHHHQTTFQTSVVAPSSAA